MTGVIYARYSSDNQREESIEGQLRECTAFAQKNDIKIIEQITIAQDVMQNRRNNADFKNVFKGFMIESFLEEGSQSNGEVFGKSITDPCLGWADTERLLCEIAEQV